MSFDDFVKRTGLSNAVLAKLSRADAFGSLELNRRTALWESLPNFKQLPLFDGMDSADDGPSPKRAEQAPRLNEVSASDLRAPTSALPPMSPLAEVVADYRSAGLSLRDHPLKFIRPQLEELRVVQAAELAVLPTGRRLKVAGLVLLRQRPGTASGITFVTLEDETGMANLIVRPEIWERDHQAARTARVMLAQGVLQRQHGVIHVLVDRLEDLSSQMTDGNFHSRDFR